MIRPTWDEWFIDEVEGASVDGLTIWYLGATGFVVRSNTTTLYIDPYFGNGAHRPDAVRMCPIPMHPDAASQCDAIFVTHEHADHMHPPSYAPLATTSDAEIYAPETCFTDPDYDGSLQAPPQRRVAVSPDDTVEIGDLTVYVFDAKDDDSIEPVSYLVVHESGTFYHGGDTKYTERLVGIGDRFNVTVAALAFGTVGQFYRPEEKKAEPVDWYMEGDEIIKAANALRTERLLPTHYNLWKGFEADPKSLHDNASSFQHPKIVEVARVGDRLNISQPGIIPPKWAQ